jgi:N-acetyl sugar amidotransferase
MIHYCLRCILPDSRPGTTLDGRGVCSACRGHEDKDGQIDWQGRGAALRRLADDVKALGRDYDCIVPVSGGKDSWYQVIACQELGLKVLAVTWRTPARTQVGQENLDSLIMRLGVDHIDYTINPDVERRFMKAAFEIKGATAIPMHMALFAIPIRLAVQLGVPLVVWGENPQLEFGGQDEERLATDLDPAWVRRHGVSNQTVIEDWIGKGGLSASDLAAYRLPPDEAFHCGTRSIFLGSYMRWNSFENAAVAGRHGFVSYAADLRTGLWEFADIDCGFISLHHFLKWHKFGLTRAFDNLSVQIRYGMTSRDEAIATLAATGLQVPHEDIKRFCTFVGESEDWFWATAESFRNLDIWTFLNGQWTIPGFLISDWDWGH